MHALMKNAAVGALALIVAGPLAAQDGRTAERARSAVTLAQASASLADAAPAGGPAYTRARELLNDRRYREAAAAFAALREQHPRSGYVGDSYYWQAFALHREGGRERG